MARREDFRTKILAVKYFGQKFWRKDFRTKILLVKYFGQKFCRSKFSNKKFGANISIHLQFFSVAFDPKFWRSNIRTLLISYSWVQVGPVSGCL